uniref:Putative 5.3 kDa protein n=1 Tax=Ixodes ricinus TaxID=34613 RepID=A0A0K8R7M8_IXORI
MGKMAQLLIFLVLVLLAAQHIKYASGFTKEGHPRPNACQIECSSNTDCKRPCTTCSYGFLEAIGWLTRRCY